MLANCAKPNQNNLCKIIGKNREASANANRNDHLHKILMRYIIVPTSIATLTQQSASGSLTDTTKKAKI